MSITDNDLVTGITPEQQRAMVAACQMESELLKLVAESITEQQALQHDIHGAIFSRMSIILQEQLCIAYRMYLCAFASTRICQLFAARDYCGLFRKELLDIRALECEK